VESTSATRATPASALAASRKIEFIRGRRRGMGSVAVRGI
jgi:hypothetical protein